jgi:hypothetical protein
MNENDEVVVTYFLLCDHVLLEQTSGKVSLIGITHELSFESLPARKDFTVAMHLRVQSARPREFDIRLNGPDGELIFSTQTPMTFDWPLLENQIRVNGYSILTPTALINGIPLLRPGLHIATLECDGRLLVTYPFTVHIGQAGAPDHW